MTGNDCISEAAESQFSEKRSAKPHGCRDVFLAEHGHDLVRAVQPVRRAGAGSVANTVGPTFQEGPLILSTPYCYLSRAPHI
jgi:hypothetical protein